MDLKCANCGIEIRWNPTTVDGKTYCCIGCSQGGPCTCDYEHLPSAGADYGLPNLAEQRLSTGQALPRGRRGEDG